MNNEALLAFIAECFGWQFLREEEDIEVFQCQGCGMIHRVRLKVLISHVGSSVPPCMERDEKPVTEIPEAFRKAFREDA